MSNVKRRRLSLITDVIILGLFLIIIVNTIDVENYVSSDTLSFTSTTSDIIEENNLYMKKIKKEYNIDIEYGAGTQYMLNKVQASAQNNENIINTNLKQIYSSLQKYPKTVFLHLKQASHPFLILIVDSFEDATLALASRNTAGEYRMYICNAEKFERAFHHEMYHILEYYMEEKNKNIYGQWNTLNPSDFEYISDISKLDYTYVYGKDLENISYFLTKYSKTTQKEDRAEVFAEMMMLTKNENFIEESSNIRKKVDKISSTLYYNVTVSDFYFNRYLKGE